MESNVIGTENTMEQSFFHIEQIQFQTWSHLLSVKASKKKLDTTIFLKTLPLSCEINATYLFNPFCLVYYQNGRSTFDDVINHHLSESVPYFFIAAAAEANYNSVCSKRYFLLSHKDCIIPLHAMLLPI